MYSTLPILQCVALPLKEHFYLSLHDVFLNTGGLSTSPPSTLPLQSWKFHNEFTNEKQSTSPFVLLNPSNGILYYLTRSSNNRVFEVSLLDYCRALMLFIAPNCHDDHLLHLYTALNDYTKYLEILPLRTEMEKFLSARSMNPSKNDFLSLIVTRKFVNRYGGRE